jgi:hypothetical protein
MNQGEFRQARCGWCNYLLDTLSVHFPAQRLGNAPPIDGRLGASRELVQANWEETEVLTLKKRDR